MVSSSADRVLKDVVIFTVGTHTDSQGVTKSFTKEDLDSMVAAFDAGVPPAVPTKAGHSSDQHNDQVANALNIPTELLVGEGNKGRGQVRLGQIISLKNTGDLVADIRIPQPVAKLITDKLFTGVSSEIQFDRVQGGKTWPRVVSGLAMLGAQRPALTNTSSLQDATMLEDGSYANAVFVFETSNYEVGEYAAGQLEGSINIPPHQASTNPGDSEEVYTVPLRDITRGRHVFASVSAPNEITAKRTALRVVENFLFSVGGPLGTAVGATLGTIASVRLVAGKPILGGIKGFLKWKFEEPYTQEDFDEAQIIFTQLKAAFEQGGEQMTQQNLAAPEGVSPEKWNACLTKARADGTENPESHCRGMFEAEKNSDQMLSEIAKALDMSEWDQEKILVSIKAMKESNKSGEQSFEEVQASNKALVRELHLGQYSAETAKLTLVPGTTEELAEKLMVFEETGGKSVADEILASWKQQQVSADAAKVAQTALTPHGDNSNQVSFEEKVAEYQKEHPEASARDAFTAVSRSNPELRNSTREVIGSP